MNLKLPHWVMVAVTVIGALAPQVGQMVPSLAPAMTVVAQFCTLAVCAIGVISPSALGTLAAKKDVQ